MSKSICDYKCVREEKLSLEEFKEGLRMVDTIEKGITHSGKYPERIVKKMCPECALKHINEI